MKWSMKRVAGWTNAFGLSVSDMISCAKTTEPLPIGGEADLTQLKEPYVGLSQTHTGNA